MSVYRTQRTQTRYRILMWTFARSVFPAARPIARAGTIDLKISTNDLIRLSPMAAVTRLGRQKAFYGNFREQLYGDPTCDAGRR